MNRPPAAACPACGAAVGPLYPGSSRAVLCPACHWSNVDKRGSRWHMHAVPMCRGGVHSAPQLGVGVIADMNRNPWPAILVLLAITDTAVALTIYAIVRALAA